MAKKPVDPAKKNPPLPPSHRFQKGFAANPAGRPKGSVGKFSMEQARAAAESGVTPLQFLLALMRCNPETLAELRVNPKEVTVYTRKDAAVQAAPYVHRKMPIGIDNGAGGPVGIYTPDQLMRLTDEEVEKLAAIVGKLAVLSSSDGEGSVE